MNSLQNVFKALLLLFVLVAGSCKHEPPAEPVDCGEATTIEEMMEWIYFKQGTYWIYEEQNSGAIDTMTVIESHQGYSQGGNRAFSYTMSSSHDGAEYEYWYNESWSGNSVRPECKRRVVFSSRYFPGWQLYENSSFVFPMFIGNKATQYGNGIVYGETRITDIEDSLLLGGLSFGNVVTYHMDYSAEYQEDSAEIVIAKNIGIVQKIVRARSENWKLNQYQILQ
jgi:hypothetical protein